MGDQQGQEYIKSYRISPKSMVQELLVHPSKVARLEESELSHLPFGFVP
jgi:hypothetical protein